jgi:cyclopropane fatty-acyl-phospholipid synthase-like methyltransferase
VFKGGSMFFSNKFLLLSILGIGFKLGPRVLETKLEYLKNTLHIDCMIANARDIPEELYGKFDVIVCNGSMEHFLPVEEVRKGNEFKIYTNFFDQCSKLFDTESTIKKQCITMLHKNPLRYPKWTLNDWFNAYLIAETYGGYYPDAPNGLTKYATKFKVIKQYDATLDYELTSREGVDGASYDFGSRFKRNWSLNTLVKLGAMAICDPYYIQKELYYGFNSWRWQFKNENCIHYWIVLQLK